MHRLARPRLEGETLDRLAAFVGLELGLERRALVGSVVDVILRSIDAIDSINLGDVPPETGFDPRWER